MSAAPSLFRSELSARRSSASSWPIALAIIVIVQTMTWPSTSYSQQSQELKERARVVYEQTSDIPDEVYLPGFLNLFEVRYYSRYDGSIDRLAAHVNDKMFLHDMDEARVTAQYLLDLSVSLNKEVGDRTETTLCNTAGRSLGQQVYADLDAIDGYRAALGRIYLKQIRREFGEYKYKKFDTWMDSRKASSTLIFFDNEKANRGRDPEVVRQQICARLESQRDNT